MNRRRGSAPLGAHPERRVLVPGRRAALRVHRPGRRLLAVVMPSVINMYERADDRAPVVSQAPLGTPVTILESRRGWYLIATPDRYPGWVRTQALRHIALSGERYPGEGRGVEIANLLANIYREPDVTSAAPIAIAPMLSRLEIQKDGPEWQRLLLPDGRVGFMQRGDGRPLAPPAAGLPDLQAVAATALRFLGLPYLWGGCTTFGLDCSGLVQLAYRAHGYQLPRDADLQFADARLHDVARRRIRAGDLIFFGPDAKSITHVGIALGEAAFVNATTYGSPVVRIDRLSDPYWRKLYRGVRRPG